MRWLIAVALFTLLETATDLTGMWSLDLKPDFGGNDDNIACTFQQDGAKLTANCGGGPNISGEVRDRTVTLLIKTGPKNEFVARFVGELDQSETTIDGTWRLEDDTGKREGKFTAKKLGR
jgi:hypothetical protein